VFTLWGKKDLVTILDFPLGSQEERKLSEKGKSGRLKRSRIRTTKGAGCEEITLPQGGACQSPERENQKNFFRRKKKSRNQGEASIEIFKKSLSEMAELQRAPP